MMEECGKRRGDRREIEEDKKILKEGERLIMKRGRRKETIGKTKEK